MPDLSCAPGLLMLSSLTGMASLLDSALVGANGGGAPVRIAYRALPARVPAVWEAPAGQIAGRVDQLDARW
ncbi:MAG: hypothetical protein R2855_01525 [Thermomicrobiales bacterium]